MPKAKRSSLNIIGKRFGRWIVLHAKPKTKPILFHCLCDCGNRGLIPKGNLRSGASKSCGCLRKKLMSKWYTTHGEASMAHRSVEYQTWLSIKQRCSNPKHQYYNYYGAKGIKICKKWKNSYVAFLKDMGRRPPGLSIDRYPNPFGDYEPTNCRWANNSQQARNTRKTTRIKFNGKTKTAYEWEAITGIKAREILRRSRRGWPTEKTLTQPMKHYSGRIKSAAPNHPFAS